MNSNALATQTDLLLDLGYRNNWDFVCLGQAPVPTQPVRVGEWLIVSALTDTSPIPKPTMQRIQTIYREGLRPQSWVLVHEAPYLLCPPKQDKPKHIWPYFALLGSLGLLLGCTLLAASAAVDPILIAITPEIDWVEIDRWMAK
ncbi:MAG: hypothetical protein PWQ55_1476 [Chloroflexota bacterium]|nr:hypothetical protein [Chloroflexota bacterium]